MMPPLKPIPADRLRHLTADVFTATGCSRPEAERVARYLVAANLAGHDSHGVARIPRYVQMQREGMLLADRQIQVVVDTPVLAVVDGLGLDRPVGVGHSKGGAALLLAEEARPGTFAALWCFDPVVFPSTLDAPVDGDGEHPLAAGAARRREVFPSRAEAFANYRDKPPFSVVSEEALIQGSFFRSDHFPLVRAGVPALSLESGRDYVGKPKGWGEEQSKEYEEKRYHQPSDELLPWFSYDGTLQQLRVMLRTAVAAANAASQPVWAAGSEFREAGERRRAK